MKWFKRIFLSLFLLFILAILATIVGYVVWEKKTFREDTSIVCEAKELNIEDKVYDFVNSQNRSEFVTLEPSEVIHILSSNFQTGEFISLDEVCIKPSEGMWKLYIKVSVGKLHLPWVSFDFVKDSRETAEIYSGDMYLGGYNMPKFIEEPLLEAINKGISDALLLAIENDFLGRKLNNIEFLEERIVLKGSID